MAKDLKQYLEEHTGQGFRPVPHYFASGDFVSYYFRNDRCYAQRVDDLLTVYLAIGTGELVGCKIKGVKHILDTAGIFGVMVDDGNVRLGLLFFYGAARAEGDEQKKRYEELARVAKDVTLDRKELQPA
jgi:hypothetical protein